MWEVFDSSSKALSYIKSDIYFAWPSRFGILKHQRTIKLCSLIITECQICNILYIYYGTYI